MLSSGASCSECARAAGRLFPLQPPEVGKSMNISQIDPLQASTAVQDEEGLDTLHTGPKAAPGKHSRCVLPFAHDSGQMFIQAWHDTGCS